MIERGWPLDAGDCSKFSAVGSLLISGASLSMLSISIISSTPLQHWIWVIYRTAKGVAIPIIYQSHPASFKQPPSPIIHWIPYLAWKFPSVSSDSWDLWNNSKMLEQHDHVEIRSFYSKKKRGLTMDIICGCCFWNWLEGGAIHDATLLNLAATIERWTYTNVTLKGHQSSIKQPQNIQIPAWKLRMGLLPSSSSHDNAFCTYISMHMHRKCPLCYLNSPSSICITALKHVNIFIML